MFPAASRYLLTMNTSTTAKVDIRNCYDVEGTLFPKDRKGLESAIEFAAATESAVFSVRGLKREFVWNWKDAK